MRLLRYNHWKNNNQNIIKESVSSLSVLDGDEYVNFKAGDVTKSDVVVKEMLDDIERAARATNVHVLATCAITDHAGIHDDYSRHPKGQALDLARIGDSTTPHNKLKGNPQSPGGSVRNQEFVDAADRLVGGLIDIGYKLITQDPTLRQRFSSALAKSESSKNPKILIWKYYSEKAGNHYNHIHISNTGGTGSAGYEPKIGDDYDAPTFSEDQIEKIYTTEGDPYKYCVINGVWYAKEGPKNPDQSWQFFIDWTSLQLNCDLTANLDKKFIGARTEQEIESNRQNFCSYDKDVQENKQKWYQMVTKNVNYTSKKTELSNNNPGNIRYNPDFKGCVGEERGFCKFAKVSFGYRAILVVLHTYFDKYKLDTIRGIISRYCPPIECDTEAYIKLLTSESGFSATQKLEKQDLVKLIPGIAKQENSIDISLEEVINLINQSEYEDLTISDTITHSGENSTMFTPMEYEGELPFMIIYPSSQGLSFMDDVIIQEFSDWSTKYGIVFADDYNANTERVLEDIELGLEDTKMELGNITMILCDDSVNRDVMYNLQSIENLKNLILINPRPNSNIISELKSVIKLVNVYVGYDSQKLATDIGLEPSIKYILDLRTAMREALKGTEREKNVNDFIKEFKGLDDIELAKSTLKAFTSQIEQVM
jgi:hypothetical protein